jgi:N-methylhydantoinase A
VYRIGIDVGGTFTDFTLVNEQDGSVAFHKIPSTPHDLSEAIGDGIGALLAGRDIDPAFVAHVGHGTTVATNLIIENKGAPGGLITSEGFRDILEIGRQTRPHLFDYSVGKPAPLVARHLRLEVPERLDAAGNVVVPLDEAAVRRAAERLRDADVQAITIFFLHSYRNPGHERRARDIVREVHPDAYVSISSDVLPEFREFERLSTTVLNSAIGPRMERYVARFLERVERLGVRQPPLTVHSNGGLMSATTVRQFPVRTCLSGPAAGVVGAATIGRALGRNDLITFDVGGTSTDVSVIHDGTPLFTSHRHIAGHALKTPMVDIHVIGAGGGSIVWIDDAGSLKVGPHSAGAVPGPVGYARGGTLPTITDAQIVLGRLNPSTLLKGAMKVDAAGARRAIDERVAQPLGLTREDAAEGAIRIANANMSRAIRSMSTERGYDLASFCLFAYGGAGPLHAVEVAEECGIPVVVVPREPGTMCARGMLLADISFDFVRSIIATADAACWSKVLATFEELRREADAWLASERVDPSRREFRCTIDARYEGQNFEVQVPLGVIATDGLDRFKDAFHQAHEREYRYQIPGRTVQIVNCRLQAVGRVMHAPLAQIEATGDLDGARVDTRSVYLGKAYGWRPAPIYDRERLPAGSTIDGPAIIEEMSSTTLVAPGQSVHVDTFGNLVITLAESALDS